MNRISRTIRSTRYFFFQAEDGIRDLTVTGVQTCALPISADHAAHGPGDLVDAGREEDAQPAVAVDVRRHAEVRGVERSEEHTSELQSQSNLVCRLLLEKKNKPEPLHRYRQTRPDQRRVAV